MSLFHSISTNLLLYVACTLFAAVDSAGVTLSADALPIPGGYVVPERGNVTFTCNSSSDGVLLFWKVDLKSLGHTPGFATSAGLADQLNVSSPDEGDIPNPTSFTVHNIPAESNGSFVECTDAESHQNATLVVEGSPNCPMIETTITSESLTVSVQRSHTYRTWLPVWYHVEVASYNASIATVYNFTSTYNVSIDVTSIQPSTLCNISVAPCNVAGCNESCDIHSVQTIVTDPMNASRPGDNIIFSVTAAAAVVVLLSIAMVTTVVVTVACTNKRKETSTKSSSVEASQQTPTQFHHDGASSATELHYKELGGGVTSNDVVMEDNPVYQPLEVTAMASAPMECDYYI